MGRYRRIGWAHERVELFDLKQDLSETSDLSQSMPEKVKAMDAVLMRYLEGVDAIFPDDKELAVDREKPLMKKGGK